MNLFCVDCRHKDVDKDLKIVFNKFVKNTFLFCPETDVKVKHCFIKNLSIDWDEFNVWATKNYLLKKEEVAAAEEEK